MAEMKIISGRNQKSIMESMLNMIKDRTGDRYNDMTENDIIYIMTEAFSHGISQLSFYHDKAVLELNPKTVQTEMGKANLISSSGGTLEFFRGNYGYITATMKVGTANNTIIPKYTKVTIDGKDYYVDRDTTYTNNDNREVLLSIRQGKLKNVQFSKSNISRDRLLLKDMDTESSGVCFESIGVSNQGGWKRTEDVFFNFVNSMAGESLKVYSIDKTTDRKPMICLMKDWDSQMSKYANNMFRVTYAITEGDLLPFIPINTDCKVELSSVESAITSTEIRGGKAPDYTLNRQLEKAIKESRTMWTAVTKDDFDILSCENDDVLASVTYDINEKNIEVINSYLESIGKSVVEPLQILISLVDSNTLAPNQKLIDDVFSVLEKRKLNIFTLRYIEPVITTVNYNVVVKTVGESFVLDNNEIESIISELYKSNISFGKNIVTNSSIVAKIHSLSKNVYDVEVTKTNEGSATPFTYYSLGNINVAVEVI